MTSYSGRHADLYDIFYGDKPYEAEAAFVDQCLRKYSDNSAHKLLELACGTGTHAFELEKLGHQLLSTDYSEDMLSRAKKKAADKSSRVEFRFQDMTKLDLPEAPFDAAICLFDAIGYVQTNEALEQVFRGVKQHLKRGGLFIFEFWHAGAMIRHYDPVRVRRWETANSTILRISETVLEIPKQLSRITYSVFELNHAGTYSSFSETQSNRYFLLQEMNARVSQAGFTALKFFSGFTESEIISDETWHIVAVARRD